MNTDVEAAGTYSELLGGTSVMLQVSGEGVVAGVHPDVNTGGRSHDHGVLVDGLGAADWDTASVVCTDTDPGRILFGGARVGLVVARAFGQYWVRPREASLALTIVTFWSVMTLLYKVLRLVHGTT